MKILIVEDDGEKSTAIRVVIGECSDKGQCDITEVKAVNDALHALGSDRFDLIVADLMLPQMRGSVEATDATPQWCEHIENHSSGRLSAWVVMTGYSDIAASARQSFARHGVAVVEYDETGVWRKILASRIRESFVNPALDFLIICALEKERFALLNCEGVETGGLSNVVGLDCRELTISGKKGVAVVLPRPGLVSAAMATTKAAEAFKPRAIAMSGICGGIKGETELGDIVAPDISWNYQSGKFIGGKLYPEIVQTQVSPLVKVMLQQMANESLSTSIRQGLLYSELKNKKIKNVPMVSGSQVVADYVVGAEIVDQSRKVGAVDMEVASVYGAAFDFFNGGGIFFAAKTVVDLADEAKDDRYHEYGCAISARFVVAALTTALGEGHAVAA